MYFFSKTTLWFSARELSKSAFVQLNSDMFISCVFHVEVIWLTDSESKEWGPRLNTFWGKSTLLPKNLGWCLKVILWFLFWLCKVIRGFCGGYVPFLELVHAVSLWQRWLRITSRSLVVSKCFVWDSGPPEDILDYPDCSWLPVYLVWLRDERVKYLVL